MILNTIIHLEMKHPNGNKHYYYGSKTAIFTNWTSDELGVSIWKLMRFNLSSSNPYENDRIIIRKGTIVRKSQRPHATFDPFK